MIGSNRPNLYGWIFSGEECGDSLDSLSCWPPQQLPGSAVSWPHCIPLHSLRWCRGLSFVASAAGAVLFVARELLRGRGRNETWHFGLRRWVGDEEYAHCAQQRTVAGVGAKTPLNTEVVAYAQMASCMHSAMWTYCKFIVIRADMHTCTPKYMHTCMQSCVHNREVDAVRCAKCSQ